MANAPGSSFFKFDTHVGSKQRVAHKSVHSSTTLLEDLKHKKLSITQGMVGNKIAKKNHALEQCRLSPFFGKQCATKRLKLSKTNSSDDAFIDDQELDKRSTGTELDDVDNDDLAIGGRSTTGWLSKKSSYQKKIQVAEMSLPVSSCIAEPKFPSSPPMDFLVKRRAVFSSDDDHPNHSVSNKHDQNVTVNKTILLSDEDEDHALIKNKNNAVVLTLDTDDGEWLSKADNNGGETNKFKKNKKKESEQRTLKDLKRKAGKLMKNKEKRQAISSDEACNESGDHDSDADLHLQEPSFDSDDSDAKDYLSAKQLKRLRELEQKCLEFVNTASIEELTTCEKFSKHLLEFIVDKRPFETFRELRQKTNSVIVTGQGKRGKPMNLARSLDSYLEWLENRGILDQVLDDCNKHSKSIEKELEELKNKKPVERPAGLNPDCSLHSYQQVGLNWLIMMNKLGLNAILADEMGLGKTIQVIAFLAWAKDQSRQENPNVHGPHLIVVPSSTIENWMQEISHWAPNLRVLPYYGSIEERQHLRHSARKHEVDLILTTYNMVISRAEDRKFFKKFTLNYVIYDEGHMLRNCATARYTNLMRIRGKRKILLTGTPLQNNLVELISLLYFTMRELFDKYCEDINSLLQMFAVKGKVLMDQHQQKNDRKSYQLGRKQRSSIDDDVIELQDQKIQAEAINNKKDSLYENHKIIQAKGILQPFVLRRLKIEVLSCLPSKHERIEFCEPTTVQANLYAELVANLRARKELGGGNGGGLDLLMQMRQVANHPLLYRCHYHDEKIVEMAKALCQKEKFYEKKRSDYLAEDLAYESDIALHMLCRKFQNTLGHFSLDEHRALESGKCKILDRLLPSIIDDKNEKVLIFSQFTSLLDILELYLHCRNYKFLRLDGQTPVLERQELINMFNEDSNIPVFLLSTKAGGLGINLTAANHIIIHDIDMNPYNDKQAEDRCHRMGQTKDVHVVRLIGKNSIEEQMLSLAKQKLELERTVTSSSCDNSDNAHTRSSKKIMEELLQQALR